MNKEKLLEIVGKQCAVCGYDKCMRALHMHHILPPSDGLAEWRRGSKTVTNSIAKLPEWLQLEQIDRVITLCANCHAEVHDGLHPDIPCPEDNATTKKKKVVVEPTPTLPL